MKDNTPDMKIVGGPGQEAAPAEKKQPTMEELREEFAKMLEEPIVPEELEKAKVQVLLCDIQIAQLKQAVAGLEAQIADNEAEIAKHELAKAIIARRLANKA